MRAALLPVITAVLAVAACGGGAAGASEHRAATAHVQQSPTATTASPTPATAAPTPSPSAGASPSPAAGAPAAAAASSTNSHPMPGQTASPVPAGTIVTSWNSPKYGQILVAANGHVLYLFVPDDATGTNTCNCPSTWPPLTTKSGPPKAAGQVQQSLLGVSNGQVTYNGHPLYFYYMDTQAYQTNGQGVNKIWYVVNVSGNANTG